MKLFSEEDSRAKRGVVIVGGLAAAAALLVLSLIVVTSREAAPEQRTVKKRRSVVVQESYALPAIALSQITPAAPTREHKVEEVARAMDLSNVRSLVRTLMEAAATDNRSIRKSMMSALGRYGRQAQPLLREELARADNVSVRKALEEALRQAQ